jgi:hypothetical protein
LRAGVARADVDKCQQNLEKEMLKLEKDAALRLSKCLDFAAKEKVKRQKRIDDGKADNPNWDWTKAAFLCEIQLSKTYGTNADGADGTVKKYDDKINGLAGTKCTRNDLIKIGHQVPSAGGADGSAPGTADLDFVREFLKVASIKRAIVQVWTANPDARDLLQSVIEGFPSGDFGKQAKGLTDCSSNRPNLCQFHRDTPSAANSYATGTGSLNMHCRVHECELDATDIINDPLSPSKATIELAGGANIPVTLNGSLAFEWCKLEELLWLPAVYRDFMFVIGEPNRTLVRTFLDSDTAICIDGWGAEGWCGCQGGGPPVDHDFCIDHNVDPTEDCGAIQEPELEECFCVDPAGPNPCGGVQQDDCILLKDAGNTIPCTADNTACTAVNASSRCNATVLGEPCHPSLSNSTFLSFTGSPSGPGACSIYNIQTITIVDQDKWGPDLVPCTEDDEQPTNSQSTTVFTTGQTRSILYSAAATLGECHPTAPNAQAKCVRDEDCGGSCSVSATVCGVDADCPEGEICNLANCFGGTILTQHENTATGGLALLANACELMETSNLQGLQLVSSFPFADGLGLGDGTATNEFVCR